MHAEAVPHYAPRRRVNHPPRPLGTSVPRGVFIRMPCVNYFGNSELRWLDNLLYLDKRDRKIIEMWMACCTQEEIADSVGCAKSVVNEVCSEKFRETEANKPAAN